MNVEEPGTGLYVSAAHKSSGKTLISTGLCAEACRRGLAIQAFKKGPDYIDPLWLSSASGRPCLNLDFHTQSRQGIRDMYAGRSRDAEISLVEGNKGLHDGVAVDGSDCNAELASLLSLPVVLVLDTQGTTRGVAPLLLGYQKFDPRINIIGVILNKVAGPRHEEKLRANIEAHTGMKVFGAIPRDARLVVEERHLGLVPSSELDQAKYLIEQIRQTIVANVDMDALLGSRSGGRLPEAGGQEDVISLPAAEPDIRIGVPRDRAFGFYYVDDLEAMRRAGAEVRFFDSLQDTSLPGNIDALYLGGGFPEVHMEALQENADMRNSIRLFVESGAPVYAECGGMMYLGQSISWGGKTAEMVGALPFRVHMENRPVGRGYVELEETGESPWGQADAGDGIVRAHEFHYSRLELLESRPRFAYRVRRGWGIDGEYDGLVCGNTLASYSHLRAVEPANWVARFVDFARNCNKNADAAMKPSGLHHGQR